MYCWLIWLSRIAACWKSAVLVTSSSDPSTGANAVEGATFEGVAACGSVGKGGMLPGDCSVDGCGVAEDCAPGDAPVVGRLIRRLPARTVDRSKFCVSVVLAAMFCACWIVSLRFGVNNDEIEDHGTSG